MAASDYTLKDINRFYSKIIKPDNPDSCWEWTAGGNQMGYGQLRMNGKPILAHRLSYELYYGVKPGKLFVCHHCDNPPCCNPKHLFLGTCQDNVDDMMRKDRFK